MARWMCSGSESQNFPLRHKETRSTRRFRILYGMHTVLQRPRGAQYVTAGRRCTVSYSRHMVHSVLQRTCGAQCFTAGTRCTVCSSGHAMHRSVRCVTLGTLCTGVQSALQGARGAQCVTGARSAQCVTVGRFRNLVIFKFHTRD